LTDLEDRIKKWQRHLVDDNPLMAEGCRPCCGIDSFLLGIGGLLTL
jgi:hypothetical protein